MIATHSLSLALLLSSNPAHALELTPPRLKELGSDRVGGIPLAEPSQVFEALARGETKGLCGVQPEAEAPDDLRWLEYCKGDFSRVVLHGPPQAVWGIELRVADERLDQVKANSKRPRHRYLVARSRTQDFERTDREGVVWARPREGYTDVAHGYWVILDPVEWKRQLSLYTLADHMEPALELLAEARYTELRAHRKAQDFAFHLEGKAPIQADVDRVLAGLDDMDLETAILTLVGLEVGLGVDLFGNVLSASPDQVRRAEALRARVEAESPALLPATRWGVTHLAANLLGPDSGDLVPDEACDAFGGRYAAYPPGVGPGKMPAKTSCTGGAVANSLVMTEVAPLAIELETQQVSGSFERRTQTREHVPSELELAYQDQLTRLEAAYDECSARHGSVVANTVVLSAGGSRTYNEQRYACDQIGCGTEVWEVTETTAARTVTGFSYPCSDHSDRLARMRRTPPPTQFLVTTTIEQIPYDGELWTGTYSWTYTIRSGDQVQTIAVTLPLRLEYRHETSRRDDVVGYVQRMERPAFDRLHEEAVLDALRARIDADIDALDVPPDVAARERAWRRWLYAGDPPPYAVR